MIRDAVARHLGGAPVPASPVAAPVPSLKPQAPSLALHPSQVQYHIINVTDACVIEPTVTCNHCGYCKCHGH